MNLPKTIENRGTIYNYNASHKYHKAIPCNLIVAPLSIIPNASLRRRKFELLSIEIVRNEDLILILPELYLQSILLLHITKNLINKFIYYDKNVSEKIKICL